LFLNNRHYNPTTGVFVSVDPPVTLTMEPYIYGSANPVMISDPSGLCGCEFFGDPSTKESHDFYGVKYPGDPGGNTYSSASDQKSISAAIRGAWSSPGATTPHEPATSGFGYEAGQKAEAAFKFLVFDSDACGGESLDGWCAFEVAMVFSPCKGPLKALCKIPGIRRADEAVSTLDRAGSGLKDDVYHRAVSWAVDSPAAQRFVIRGGDGVQRSLFQLPGRVNNREGVFEWIVQGSGGSRTVTHQRFIPGGTVTGLPNQVVGPP